MDVIRLGRWAAALLIPTFVIGLAVALVLGTYYTSDDFVLLYEGVRPDSGWQNWIAPFFGHFGPGSFALTRVVAGVWSLDRLGAAVFTLVMLALDLVFLYGIARAVNRNVAFPRGRLLGLAGLSIVSVGLAIPILFYALGASLLPLSVVTVAAIFAGLQAHTTRRWFWWVISGVIVVIGLGFWELAALNIFLVPAFVWALARLRPPASIGAARAIRWRAVLAYGVPVSLGALLYLYNYRRFSFDSGVTPAALIDVSRGLVTWLGYGMVALLGGGPFPTDGQGLGLGASLSLSWGSAVPWLVGLGVLACGLAVPRVRVIALLVLGAAVLHGAAILRARYNFLGPDFVLLNPRYYSGLVPYVQVLFLALWSTVLIRRPNVSRGLRLATALILAMSCGIALASWIQFARQIGGQDRRVLIERMLTQALRAPSDATMLSSRVSGDLGWLAPPYDNTRVVLWPVLGDWRWGAGDGTRPMVVDQAGDLAPAILRPVSVWNASPGSGCARTAAMPFVAFDEPISRPVVLTIDLSAGQSQEITLDLNGSRRSLVLPAGPSRQVIQQYWYGTMNLEVLSPSADACLTSVSIAEVESQSASASRG